MRRARQSSATSDQLGARFTHQRWPSHVYPFGDRFGEPSSELADVPPRDRASFDARWADILRDPDILIRTIEVEGEVAGYVFSFPLEGEPRLGYWLGRDFWGRGIASRAVAQFLVLETRRPLHATVHEANTASIRILDRCGFKAAETGSEAGHHLRLD